MDRLRLGVAAVLLAVLCPSHVSVADEVPSKPAPAPAASNPLVAAVWVKLAASGAREVVIEPNAEKLQAHGSVIHLKPGGFSYVRS